MAMAHQQVFLFACAIALLASSSMFSAEVITHSFHVYNSPLFFFLPIYVIRFTQRHVKKKRLRL